MSERNLGMEIIEPTDIKLKKASDINLIKHYDFYIGEPERAFKFNNLPIPDLDPFFVVEFAPNDERSSWLYGTVGVSHQPMPYPDEWQGRRAERRIELVMYVRQPKDEIAEFLADLAVYPFECKTFFGPGHTVTNEALDSGRGIIKGSPLTDIVLTRTLFENPEFDRVIYDDDNFVDMLWAIPVYPSERLLARERGFNALADLFDRYRTDASNLRRLRVV